MTEPNQQQILREGYDRALILKHLLSRLIIVNIAGDELYLKAEQLADAIHHYIVPEE